MQTRSQQLFSWGKLLRLQAMQNHESPSDYNSYNKLVLIEVAIVMTFYLWTQIPEFSLFRSYRVGRFSIASPRRRRGTWIDNDFLWQSNGLSLKIQTCSCCSISPLSSPSLSSRVNPPSLPRVKCLHLLRRQSKRRRLCQLEIAWLGNVSHIPTCWYYNRKQEIWGFLWWGSACLIPHPELSNISHTAQALWLTVSIYLFCDTTWTP